MNNGFIVCRDKHPFIASRIHETLQQAQTEAERLCRKEKDTFLVFALVGEVRLTQSPVIWEWVSPETSSPSLAIWDDVEIDPPQRDA